MSSRGDDGDDGDDAGQHLEPYAGAGAGSHHDEHDDSGMFTLPAAPTGQSDQLTSNEQAWIEFIRVISCGSDPNVTPKRVTSLMALLDAG